MSQANVNTTDCGGILDFFRCGSGVASNSEGQTVNTLAASLIGSFASLGAQVLVFTLLRLQLSRIYRPRSYLVPEKERVPAPPQGLIGWLYPVVSTSNLAIIQKCGLDAYFFLRFLRMLVKIFVPSAFLLLPILLPVNATGSDGQAGLDKYSISNIGSLQGDRLWAHTFLACMFLIWAGYNILNELRGYIRVRQAHLTSPQHRLRASATTVLITGIPRKWLTYEALSGLYDVFPGGIRNIWINRNYDALADKIDYRTKLANNLEDAETVLIKNCRKAQLKKEEQEAKAAGAKSKTKKEKKQAQATEDAAADRMAQDEGVSAGENHEISKGLQDAVEDGEHHVAHQEKDLDMLSNAAPKSGSSNLDGTRGSQTSDETLTRPSGGSRPPQHGFDIEEPAPPQNRKSLLSLPLDVFKNNDKSFRFPSPQPNAAENDDEFPLHSATTEKNSSEKSKAWWQKLAFWQSDEEPFNDYAKGHDNEWDEDQDEEPYWRRYLEPKDRETIRLPLFSPTWWPSIPLVGKKVDRIYHLRRELARMNLEIENDQNHIDRFPMMNSAFIQFNHQIAAHMCCQSLSHHIPQQMAPRLIEISPDDIIWENMSIRWWERPLRTGIVLVICIGLIILYAVPVVFTSLLNRVSDLTARFPWLSWLNDAPSAVISIVQGILPPVLLSLILLIVPIIFRFLVKHQGVATGNDRELGVQLWLFAFLFIQVFLIPTISGGLFQLAIAIAQDPTSILTTISSSLPRASTYYFSYLTVQAFSNSASALIQIGSLLGWFILAPIMDSTARQKWRRQTTLSNVQWGSFFPLFTNFAVIGMIFSTIAPLVVVFVIIIFSLFWIVYRYNVLFVYQFRHDTGGLLFPVAINQLFVGFYFMELCLIGLFFTSKNEKGNVCYPQAIIMIVALAATVLFQVLLRQSFKPLFQYLPITLEDEAVLRDEQFAKAQESKFASLRQAENGEANNEEEREEEENEGLSPDGEDRPVEAGRSSTSKPPQSPDWKRRDAQKPLWKTEAWKKAAPEAVARLRFLADGKRSKSMEKTHQHKDVEAQHTVGDVLFGDFADEIEDLTPEDRDLLVRYAFQHSALRARRPVVWIPRDALGVSDDEIKRAKKMSTVMVDGKETTNIWMSNEGTAIDGKGRVVFRKSPPDFSNVDLVAL
ncbi:Putative calcium-dependent channel, 7TM region phosphate [Septoria linicola]|uniref:Calcium-dependent channel, 7TM region phosphate n=1 Tax=Septoria linicola TaxID=215465 RepID=A0A9Q9EHU7_9PEZI|nr:putative calcium-dependent channel, 7TM region phosphate [Septoria linicola]USW49668.1 Putative calcium-dependent channel, 7TM region phosphate [Septoria linicola]